MLVLRFGMLHETGCDDLKTTRDWLPLTEFSEESLETVDVPHCPDCLEQPVSDATAAVEEAAASVPLE